MKNYALMAALGFALALFAPAIHAGESTSVATPEGQWKVKDGTAHIRILACGAKLWGVISWAQGPGTDEHNPDPAKRTRPVLGLPILLDMAPKADEWDGQIYNADNGKIYKGHIRLTAPDTLHVSGCVLGVLCGGEDWTRLESIKDDRPTERICGGLANPVSQ